MNPSTHATIKTLRQISFSFFLIKAHCIFHYCYHLVLAHFQQLALRKTVILLYSYYSQNHKQLGYHIISYWHVMSQNSYPENIAKIFQTESMEYLVTTKLIYFFKIKHSDLQSFIALSRNKHFWLCTIILISIIAFFNSIFV